MLCTDSLVARPRGTKVRWEDDATQTDYRARQFPPRQKPDLSRYRRYPSYIYRSSTPGPGIIISKSHPQAPLVVWRGGAWSGGRGVGVRCGNGLFSTHKTPNFILASLSYCGTVGSYLRYFIYRRYLNTDKVGLRV